MPEAHPLLRPASKLQAPSLEELAVPKRNRQKTSSKSKGKVGPSFPVVVEVDEEEAAAEPVLDAAVTAIGTAVREEASPTETQGVVEPSVEARSTKTEEISCPSADPSGVQEEEGHSLRRAVEEVLPWAD
ncbi:uncharacterized protein LOC131227856 [Magnolia sinica]|uniref:uncharacterized protein LOC131227856 n=1 Tax=Magnolia sinica TaxID=86752 RepID=UPI002658B7AE|nr:uncharacterized protein LOC131227856 [Magnolia sinica]